MKRKLKRNRYRIALKIVIEEAIARRSLRPFRLLWTKVRYGGEFPYNIVATLPEYIKFCRANNVALIIPVEELA